MVNYREILRLHSQGYSQRQISASTRSARDTIREIIKRSDELDIAWPIEDDVTNEMLLKTLYPERFSIENTHKEPDYSYIHKELSKKGVNLTLLWTEYSASCHHEGTIPYMYSHFCEKYRQWARITKATMRIQHKPGDAMQVDWAGGTIPLHDKYTGEISDVYLFVAVLPCSCKVYAEPCMDMKQERWIKCHTNAYSFYGGVTRLLIPDNLKVGITSNTKYDIVINRTYEEMANHYGTAVVPARVQKPRDKSMAEGSVSFASTWIIASLRNRKFFTIEEIREAVAQKLVELNNIPFKKRAGNRNSAFLEEEQTFMMPLPSAPYEPAVWSTATILNDYLITDGINKYSVPFDLIGESVDIRTTLNTIEVFYRGSRVAAHPIRHIACRNPIVLPEHMPEAHKKYLRYNADDFLLWAQGIGDKTYEVINFILYSKQVPEQGFKACVSLNKLADKYGAQKLERACQKVLEYSSTPSVRSITTFLRNGLGDASAIDSISAPSNSKNTTTGITRGASYFSKGGNQS